MRDYAPFEHAPGVLELMSKANKLRANYLTENGTYKLPDNARFLVNPADRRLMITDFIAQRAHVQTLNKREYVPPRRELEDDRFQLYGTLVEADRDVPVGEMELRL